MGSELNANQYRIVCLAAEYDVGLEWDDHGYRTPALAIANTLDIHTSTAYEWIRVALETHNHECVDCQRTDLLELDHNPPFHETKHTITTELEPRCAPCHRARHRNEPGGGDYAALPGRTR